jgi:predicted ribosomally synthesized peptide with nif11-like leader
MKTDEDFRKKVTMCRDAEARKALVLKEGFAFTVEELNAGVEISDDAAEGIVGGICITEFYCPCPNDNALPSWVFK